MAWSGFRNALGVLRASATGPVVAFSIVHRLPVDLLVDAAGALLLWLVRRFFPAPHLHAPAPDWRSAPSSP